MGRKRESEKGGRTRWTRGATALSRLRSALSGFLFGRQVDDETAGRLREIKGLLLVGLSVWLLISLASFYTPYGDPGARGWNWGGQTGFYLANATFLSMGLAGYVAVFLCVAWGAILVAGRGVSWAGLRLFGGVMLVLSVAFLLDLSFGGEREPEDGGGLRGVSSRLPYGYGGWLAQIATPHLAEKFGGLGLFVLLLVLSLVSFLLATERAFYPTIVSFRAWLEARRKERGESFASALAHRAGAVAVGLWNFVRGADIGDRLQPAAQAAGAGAKTRAKAASAELFPASAEVEDAEEEGEAEEEEERRRKPPRATRRRTGPSARSSPSARRPRRPRKRPANRPKGRSILRRRRRVRGSSRRSTS
jgi:hypothetical protein